MSRSLSQLAEELDDTITLSSSGTYGLGPNVTIGSTYANTAITNNGVATGSLGPYTFSAGTNTAPWYSTTVSPKIKLDGEGADIEVNGLSLIKTLQEIQSRLNLLQPNTALEAEWEELFELGKKYRALEQHIKEKQATWEKLKAMPPPEID